MHRAWLPLLAVSFFAAPALAAPTLLFSDLTSGPSTGNTDTSRPGQISEQDGAIVTVWGRGLGDAQGTSGVLVGGQTARVYSWGRATAPANLDRRLKLQMIAFQIPHTAPAGTTSIVVDVGGASSNALPFTVRPGAIRFVTTAGNDDTGNGSWTAPWRTLDNLAGTGAIDKLASGDIVYVGDGVTHRVLAGDRGAIDLGAPGTPAAPKAIVGYPGATASIGDSLFQKGWSLWVSGYGPTRYWVVAKMHVTAKADVAGMHTGFRLVGNRITAPRGDGPTGAVPGQGDSLVLLGNELTNIGYPATSKLYHPIYFQSAESCSGPRLPLERDREIGWNDLHDNLAYDGVNIYRECGSSAYMVNHRVHDNWIENQTGVGIRIGDYVTGENWIWNNIVMNAGFGPEPPGDYAMHVPLHLHAGWEGTTTLIHVYNNTIVGGGFTGGQNWSSSMVGFATSHPWALDFRNNAIVSTDPAVGYLNSYLDLPPGGVTRNLWFGAGAAPTWDSAPIAADPGFVNAASGDFTPLAGSPLVDASLPLVPSAALPVPATDFYSRPRTGARADVGAVEFAGGNPVDTGGPPSLPRFRVSPNPADARIQFTLSGTPDGSPVQLIDLGGRVVAQARVAAATTTIDTGRLEPGVYFVRYRGETTRVALVR